jgi:hypothetical protein
MFFLFFQNVANRKNGRQDRKDREEPFGHGIVQKRHGAIHQIDAEKDEHHHPEDEDCVGQNSPQNRKESLHCSSFFSGAR